MTLFLGDMKLKGKLTYKVYNEKEYTNKSYLKIFSSLLFKSMLIKGKKIFFGKYKFRI